MTPQYIKDILLILNSIGIAYTFISSDISPEWLNIIKFK